MNPSNKFAIRIVHMFRTMYRRSTAIVACLMAEALDVQATHMPTKVCIYVYIVYLTKCIIFKKFIIICSIESLRKINSIG